MTSRSKQIRLPVPLHKSNNNRIPAATPSIPTPAGLPQALLVGSRGLRVGRRWRRLAAAARLLRHPLPAARLLLSPLPAARLLLRSPLPAARLLLLRRPVASSALLSPLPAGAATLTAGCVAIRGRLRCMTVRCTPRLWRCCCCAWILWVLLVLLCCRGAWRRGRLALVKHQHVARVRSRHAVHVLLGHMTVPVLLLLLLLLVVVVPVCLLRCGTKAWRQQLPVTCCCRLVAGQRRRGLIGGHGPPARRLIWRQRRLLLGAVQCWCRGAMVQWVGRGGSPVWLPLPCRRQGATFRSCLLSWVHATQRCPAPCAVAAID